MKYVKRNIIRRRLPKVYRLPYRIDAFRERERWLTFINYMCYRDVD